MIEITDLHSQCLVHADQYAETIKENIFAFEPKGDAERQLHVLLQVKVDQLQGLIRLMSYYYGKRNDRKRP